MGLLSIIITLFGAPYTSNNYQYMLPISYTLAYIILAPSINKLSWGYFTLNIIWLIRYVVSPVMYTITDFSMSQVGEDYLLIALFVMILELWVTFIATKFYYDRYKKQHQKNKRNTNKAINTPIKSISGKLVLVFILLSITIVLLDSNALSGFNFILGQEFSRRSEASFGLFPIILNITKYLITIYLMGYFGNKYRKNKNVLYVFMGVLTLFVSLSIFQGTSRAVILFEALAYVSLLIVLFPKQKKQITTVSVAAIFLLILSITLYRYYGTRDITDASSIYDMEKLTSQFNAYFAGQYNIGVGIKTLDIFGHQYNIQTILKDIFNNVIALNKLFSGINGSTFYFNYAYYNHTLWADQISPLITQALGMFNIFGFMVPFLLIKFIIKLDILTKNNTNNLTTFTMTLIAINLAFYSPGNITIISSTVINTLVPLYLISRITEGNLRSRKQRIFANRLTE